MKVLVVRSCALALWLSSSAAVAFDASAGDPTEDHVTRSASGFAGEREGDERRDPATLEELTLAPNEIVTQAKPSSGVQSVFFGDAWVYDASVTLFDDFDRDGFYTVLRVRFDADSMYDRHWIYAVLWLSPDGVNWEEVHITEDFLVRGITSRDEYEIEVELVAGYPPGYYDVLIELYDAELGWLLDEFGAELSAELELLPLEDVRHDTPPVTVSRGSGGGGAVSWVLLALLALVRAGGWLMELRRRGDIAARRSASRTVCH